MLKPNLRHVEIFLMLCETGSVSITAQRLHISQPAVSKALSQLEDTTQLALFDRRKNRLYLTQSGIALREEGTRLWNQVRRFSEEIDAQQSALRGQLAVAAIPALAFGPLSLAARRFQEVHHDVRMDFSIEMSRRIVELVAQKYADVGFIHGASDAAHVTETYLGDSEVMVMMHKDHPLAGNHRITPLELEGYPIIQMHRDSPPSAPIRESFARFGVRPNIRMEVNVSRLAASLIGPREIAFVDPASIPPNSDLVRRPFRPRIRLSIFMLTPAGEARSRILTSFCEEAQRAVREMERMLQETAGDESAP